MYIYLSSCECLKNRLGKNEIIIIKLSECFSSTLNIFFVQA
jgi:hypothetical protein